MKNIHLLPTDKPSRLVIDTIENKLYFQPILHKKTINVLPQHIHITSDEKPEDENWLLIIDDFETYVHKHKGDNLPTTYWKKIILTTDQDLIKDGVQAIDDTFLKWFVKNPSCERVEVQKFTGFAEDYLIIIPQEEPKEEYVRCNCANSLEYSNCGKKCERILADQETLEEAAEKWVFETNGHKWSNNDDTAGDNYGSFIEGANFMTEIMYSEDEVKRIAFDFYYDMSHKMNVPENLISENATNVDEWFRQFKKR